MMLFHWLKIGDSCKMVGEQNLIGEGRMVCVMVLGDGRVCE